MGGVLLWLWSGSTVRSQQQPPHIRVSLSCGWLFSVIQGVAGRDSLLKESLLSWALMGTGWGGVVDITSIESQAQESAGLSVCTGTNCTCAAAAPKHVLCSSDVMTCGC